MENTITGEIHEPNLSNNKYEGYLFDAECAREIQKTIEEENKRYNKLRNEVASKIISAVYTGQIRCEVNTDIPTNVQLAQKITDELEELGYKVSAKIVKGHLEFIISWEETEK